MRRLFIVVIAPAIATAALVAQPVQPRQNPLANNPAAIAAGQQLFDRTCQTCHGPGGRGDRAPALTGAVFLHGHEDAQIFQTIRDGVRGSQMPPYKDHSDEQIWQLVAYIQSLRRPPAATPAGGGRGAAPPPMVVVRTQDGREIRGIRRSEDTFTVQIVDAAGRLHSLDKHTLAASRVETAAPPTTNDPLPSTGGVTFDRLVKAGAEPHNWLMYWGDYQGTHYSALEADRPVQRRTPAGGVDVRRCRASPCSQATPLVVDGVMYMTQPGVVVALDARTGRQIWRYTRQQKQKNPQEINPFNRGVAHPRPPAVRRHARRRARRARCENRTAALGNAGGRHDARLQPHERAAGRQRQGASSASRAASSARAVFSMPTTRPPASACGGGTPCRDRASSATTRGWATAGSRAAARCGSPARTIRS